MTYQVIVNDNKIDQQYETKGRKRYCRIKILEMIQQN